MCGLSSRAACPHWIFLRCAPCSVSTRLARCPPIIRETRFRSSTGSTTKSECKCTSGALRTRYAKDEKWKKECKIGNSVMRRLATTDKLLQSPTYRNTILVYPKTSIPTRMDESARSLSAHRSQSRCLLLLILLLFCFSFCSIVSAQDWVKTGTSLGVEKVRLAVPDFKSSTNDPQNAKMMRNDQCNGVPERLEFICDWRSPRTCA